MITNTSAPQVVDLIPSTFKVLRPEKSTKSDSNSNHTPINQYLLCPRPPIFEILVGSKLVALVASMNRFRPLIWNSSTCWITRRKGPTIQTTIDFVGEHNYEWPHTNDDILDIEGQHPTNCDKYHHNFIWDKHFKSEGGAQQWWWWQWQWHLWWSNWSLKW